MIVEETRIDEDDLPLASRVKERRGPSVGYGSRGSDRDADRPDRPELPDLDDEPMPSDEELPGSPAGSSSVCKTIRRIITCCAY